MADVSRNAILSSADEMISAVAAVIRNLSSAAMTSIKKSSEFGEQSATRTLLQMLVHMSLHKLNRVFFHSKAASLLASFEEEVGAPIGKYFDLIVGNSTGGIIALALGLGYSAKEVKEFYQNLGPEIFNKKQNKLPAKVNLLVNAIY